MWDWCDKLKLGTSSSAFVKRDIRSLPQTEAEFEADFFLEPEFSTEGEEAWTGAVIEREHGCRARLGRRAIAAAHGQLPCESVGPRHAPTAIW